MEPTTDSVSWQTVAYWVVVPFAIGAVAIERYRVLEKGHYRRGRTVGFATAAAIALIGLGVALWAPSNTAKVVGFIYACGAVALGLRFSYLADKDEHRRESERQRKDRESDAKLAKIDDLVAHQKFALVESLHQLQAEMSVCTREYHVLAGGTVLDPQAAADLETKIFVDYWAKFETRLWFILINLETYGFAWDAEIREILNRGCNSIDDLDHIARGLHRMMEEETKRDWR